VLRQASVSFLFTQQRLSQLDTSEVSVRYDAFVSYQADDRRDVIQIVDGLSQAGLRIFFDQYIQLGADWRETPNVALRSSSALLFCVGASTFTSDGQSLELEFALLHSDTVPILLPGAGTIGDLPEFIRQRQFVDLRDGVSVDGLARLIRGLESRRRRSSS
jgi:hypothetical protein